MDDRRRSGRPPRRILLLTFPGAQTLDVTGPYEVFQVAGRLARHWRGARSVPYRVEVVADEAGPVATWSGLELVAQRSIASVRGDVDTLLVAGGRGARAEPDDAMRRIEAWLPRVARRTRRLGSVCTGAFILARAGLLDGRRATTHWRSAPLLAERFPRIEVDSDAIFVRDGRIYTSAGVTAGMDLALALVEEDLGRDLALAVARELVMFLKRPGGQSQFSEVLSAQQRSSDRLAELPSWIREHLEDDLRVEALAKRVGMSPRNFARVFTQDFGTTPARYVERARTLHARELLEETRDSLEEIATRCGFGNAERMRGSFVRLLGVVPRDYRLRFADASLREAS